MNVVRDVITRRACGRRYIRDHSSVFMLISLRFFVPAIEVHTLVPQPNRIPTPSVVNAEDSEFGGAA